MISNLIDFITICFLIIGDSMYRKEIFGYSVQINTDFLKFEKDELLEELSLYNDSEQEPQLLVRFLDNESDLKFEDALSNNPKLIRCSKKNYAIETSGFKLQWNFNEDPTVCSIYIRERKSFLRDPV